MHLGWAFISMAVLLCEEGYEHRHRCCVPRRNVTWRYTEEMEICKDGKRGPKLTVLVPWPRNSSKDPPWDVISFVDLILVALENSHRVQTGQRALCWAGCVPGRASLWLTASGLSRPQWGEQLACDKATPLSKQTSLEEDPEVTFLQIEKLRRTLPPFPVFCWLEVSLSGQSPNPWTLLFVCLWAGLRYFLIAACFLYGR